MKTLTIATLALSFIACTSEADKSPDEAGSTGSEAGDTSEGEGADSAEEVIGQMVASDPALSEDLLLELQSGVVFANLDRDGALTLALATWPDASCEVDRWFFEAPDQQGVVMVDLEEVEHSASWSWSIGPSSAAGSLELAEWEVEGASREALEAGGTLEGYLLGQSEGEMQVEAAFQVGWCGEVEAH